MTSPDDVSVTQLKGVGSKLAATLSRLGIETLQDLLFHLPFRYEDRTRIRPLTLFRPGDQGVFQASVLSARVVFGKRRSFEVKVGDDSGVVVLRFYHFSAAQTKQFEPGKVIRGFGEARLGKSGLEFYHPEYRMGEKIVTEVEDSLTPVYPLTEGIQQPRMRSLCAQALDMIGRLQIPDWMPDSVREHYQFMPLIQALLYLHRPPLDADLKALEEGRHPAQQRLILEELLAHHLSLMKLRQGVRSRQALPVEYDSLVEGQFLDQLAFTLTAAQERVKQEIAADLSMAHPMLRLVQGDVGSGKTVVAALAALQVAKSGAQVAVMAPTEILAEQHLLNFENWLSPLNIKIAWLSGKTKGKARQAALEAIQTGQAKIVIGTHALFQDDVIYERLALAIIDEQHRFGVHQRLALKNKGNGAVPHQLIMTATPIPRTLAMSAYADLDTSVIDELPPGRQQIETVAVPDSRREEVLKRVSSAVQKGRQAYWVCTLIEESEALQCQAAEVTTSWLQEQLPDVRVGLVHGRMKASEKSFMMDLFKEGRLDLLVATTVIEVGVDVPNASLIIIENPERLGLAQLHQLRGRVGRGETRSYCVLMYHPPLSQNGKARLNVLRESNDGFVIAEKDLELRGPGEVLGTRQTGLVQFKVADLQRDQEWLGAVKEIAPLVLAQPSHCDAIIRRWLGSRESYAEV